VNVVTEQPLSSASGGIHVVTTERGLPVRLRLHPRELARPPADLAAEILLLCQASAKRAQVARRAELTARGFAPDVIRGLDLATEDDLAQVVVQLRGDDDAPDTWMRPV
jgi:hypothetical protein